MENSFDVFISYSTKDKTIAEEICNYLESNGVQCWMAPRNIRPGYKYGAEIVTAIKACGAMVLVFSAHSNASEHVSNEIDIAFNEGKIIIPFKIEDVPMSDSLLYYLNNKHWIDASVDTQGHYNSLLMQCKKIYQGSIAFTKIPKHINKVDKDYSQEKVQLQQHVKNPLPVGTSGNITDPRDGNQYKWVKIGNQVWMAENMRYIPYVSPPEVQGGIWVNGYKGYSVNEAKQTINYKEYGCLYDWGTAWKCGPLGWHLPADEEWDELTAFLGGEVIAGGKLKEKETKYWDSPNEGAINSYGFSALPGGNRSYGSGKFSTIGYGGYWWSSTEGISSNGWGRFLYFRFANVNRFSYNKANGFSVRCVRDY
jgi:uncharacterized protein (TIGR02145 family)